MFERIKGKLANLWSIYGCISAIHIHWSPGKGAQILKTHEYFVKRNFFFFIFFCFGLTLPFHVLPFGWWKHKLGPSLVSSSSTCFKPLIIALTVNMGKSTQEAIVLLEWHILSFFHFE